MSGAAQVPTPIVVDASVGLRMTGRTVSDCLYIALAQRLGCVVVTADRKLYNATRGGPYATRGLWGGDRLGKR